MQSWKPFFEQIEQKLYFKSLVGFIEHEYRHKTIYPPQDKLFEAFRLTDPSRLRVVILGQDPYHQPNQAHGLAFSMMKDQPLPPSLRNVYKEIEQDLKVSMNYDNGDLTYLAKQGILLLNSYLTVEHGKPLSFKGVGYEYFMKDVFSYLMTLDQPIVFLLWGTHAKRYQSFIDQSKHLILNANHPSPLSANQGGWFGCAHFSKTNEWLTKKGYKGIHWTNKE
jgi:uracil-DNA glycosylase